MLSVHSAVRCTRRRTYFTLMDDINTLRDKGNILVSKQIFRWKSTVMSLLFRGKSGQGCAGRKTDNRPTRPFVMNLYMNVQFQSLSVLKTELLVKGYPNVKMKKTWHCGCIVHHESQLLCDNLG